MKKLVIGLFSLILVATLAACTGLNGDIGFTLTSDEDVMSFQALSTAELLSNVQPASTQSMDASGVAVLSTETDMTIDQIQPYLELFEQLLTQNNGLTVVNEVSDLPEYETKQTFTVTDILGNQVTYIMYYNTISEVEENDDSDEEENDVDENEYRIEGIMIYGEVTYQIVGEYEVDGEESELKFKSYIDELNYVESKYEVESEETKFEFQVVTNGIVVNESNIKIENEEDEFKIKLEYISGSDSGEYEFKLEEEDGQSILKIEFTSTINGVTTSGEAKVNVVVDELTGETSYVISVKSGDDDEEYEKEYDRDIDDRDDEDDDEDEDENESEDEDEVETEEESEDNVETEQD
ncbi:MAG: hypothetical protein C4537_07410 [Acholeplasma sp.]|jgi:hypothetical protein|nr:MAG: hypothetical protein C4537_07410 [Acholeplasma sp.]